MRVIDNDDFKERYPICGDLKVDEMPDEARKYYFSIYAVYQELLYKYLIKRTQIKKADEELSKKGIPEIEDKDKDFYQYCAEDILKYFYIRSNLYVERLSKEDLIILDKYLLEETFELSKEAEEMISRTLRTVIRFDLNKESDFFINYGPFTPKYFATNDSLVIGVRFDETIDDPSDLATMEEFMEKANFIDSKVNELSEIMTENLGTPVRVIQFPEEAIVKIKKNENWSLH